MVLLVYPVYSQTEPNWIDQVTNYQQPSWFNRERVQIHTRLAAPYYNNPDHPIYSNWARDVISVIGATVFTRHIKTNDDPIHWQSSWGKWTDFAENRNIIQEAINEAHTHNTKMIGYYNHYSDGYIRDNYPEYKCKDVNGNDIIREGRGTMICFNSPYIDLLATRLIEFAQMGGDGLYFDEIHMPREGCWCNYCKTKFNELTGQTAPTTINVNSQLYKDYQNFNNESVVEGFYKLRQTLEAENPDLVMIIGSNTLPKLTERHLNTNLFRLAHAHKTEWDISQRTLSSVPNGIMVPDEKVWRGLSYTFSRDISDGRPAHYWVPGMSFVPSKDILGATAGLISFGNIANLDMRETLSPDLDFINAVTYGNNVSSVFEDSKPNRWLLIHFNEKALETYSGETANGWSNFLSPFYGSYYAASENKLSVGIITDSQLKQGLFQGAKVLFTPNTETISAELQIKIDEFESQGGVVITEDPSWEWENGGTDFNNAKNEFQAILNNVYSQPLFKSNGGSGFYYVNYFEKNDAGKFKYIASYSNELEWVTVGATAQTNGNLQPDPISGIKLIVNSGQIPTSVRNVLTDTPVSFNISNGVLSLDVPNFQNSGLIELTYDEPLIAQTNNNSLFLIDDAYVQGGTNGDSNFGVARLATKRDDAFSNQVQHSYLKFDLTHLGAYQNVKLRLTKEDSINNNFEAFFVTDDSWLESTITWNTAPVAGTSLGIISSGTSPQIEWNITDIANTELSGDGIISIMIVSSINGLQSNLYSKETAPTNSKKPLLAVTVDSSERQFPVDDAYVRAGTGSEVNFGTARLITKRDDSSVNLERLSFVKFDLSNIGTNYNNLTFTLTKEDNISNTFEAFLVTDDNWSENNITWSTAPKAHTSLGKINNSTTNKLEWDITNVAQEEQNKDGIITIMIISSKNGIQSNIYSKESAPTDLDKPAVIINNKTSLNVLSYCYNCEEKNVYISPNPTLDVINITGIDMGKKIYLYNISGKMVLEQDFTPSINTKKLLKGMYFLTIVDKENFKHHFKFIKK
ncbi:hypothetical protein APS56_04590 [Pseudalgibacter alginicilyticus]|uniref:Uncharacterized protein n=2 Tax=Pseudalgibacter alginicilyticus TaxID=1736674 RepID=A0A0P0CEP8_9FLAO|nr:hypothetical protein APS56_04590 [Pseudalgibacter alginicilyticus]